MLISLIHRFWGLDSVVYKFCKVCTICSNLFINITDKTSKFYKIIIIYECLLVLNEKIDCF